MESFIYIPGSMRAANRHVRRAQEGSLRRLDKTSFLRAWCSLVYRFPGLHPDHFFDPDNRWPKWLKRFAAEAWRRFVWGELTNNEFYCYQAATTRLSREYAALEQLKPWLLQDHFSM
jgi:hypothetical protein